VKYNEANIISFKVIIDSSGTIITELSSVPENHLSRVFKDNELNIMKKLVGLAKPKLEEMHSYLEKELKSLSHI
jgi:hypothetical protein|tara:strand:+ start:2177 stop:2398 length:222 start_codon:yes stop_codon:yes gene_type:complete